MTELSPAAKAILEAYDNSPWEYDTGDLTACAAVLRAAADQVVPEEEGLNPVDAWNVEDWNHMNITRYQREETRRQLLAIAAELRGTNIPKETP